MTRAEALKIAKPIPFKTEMVQAILDGRKTVTRRVIKPKYSNTQIKIIENKYGRQLVEIQDESDVKETVKPDGTHCRQLRAMREITPLYRLGDILYVRETWFYEEHMHDKTAGKPDLPIGRYSFRYIYKASEPDYPVNVGIGANGWQSPIYMPKEAARIFLRVTGVRVERLQDCGNMQAKDEGFTCCSQFVRIWDSTVKKSDLKKYGWEANPWVWVIEFERIEVE